MSKKNVEVVEGEVTKRGPKGSRSFPKDAVINILVDANPKKPSSASYARFELYEDGMTVAEASEAGIKPADLKYDLDKGFISIG